MTIRHHLSDPLLMAYSAGQLPEAFSLVVATHVSLCDDCRSRLLAFDAIFLHACWGSLVVVGLARCCSMSC